MSVVVGFMLLLPAATPMPEPELLVSGRVAVGISLVVGHADHWPALDFLLSSLLHRLHPRFGRRATRRRAICDNMLIAICKQVTAGLLMGHHTCLPVLL